MFTHPILIYALEGCYEKLDLVGVLYLTVNGNKKTSCKERCRGRDFTYAIVGFTGSCSCTNSTSVVGPETIERPMSNCSGINTSIIYDMGKWGYISLFINLRCFPLYHLNCHLTIVSSFHSVIMIQLQFSYQKSYNVTELSIHVAFL